MSLVSFLGEKGRSALHRAARQGDAAEVQRLIEAGEDVDLRDQMRFRQRPLHYAAEEGHVEVLERLLAAKATLDAEDEIGQRPLHCAAVKGHVEVLERLLAAKATVEAKDNYGQRPLHYAAEEGHVEVLERLLAAKATVEAKDKHGRRPLHIAAEKGHVEVLERLLAAKATVDAKDKYGKTPFDVAKERGKQKVMGVLRPVRVLLLSGEAVPCDPQPDRTVRDLREEVEKKLKLKDTEIQLIASAGNKLQDEQTLSEANVGYGGFLSAVVVQQDKGDQQHAPGVAMPADPASSGSSQKRQELVTPADEVQTKFPSAFGHNERLTRSKYDLQDPQQLIQFLLDANIALVRLEYLQELFAAGRRFLRRQEAEGEFTAAGLPALVQASELQKLEIDPLGNMSLFVKDPSPRRVTVVIESISHAWESMEHPDPHGFQLDQIIQRCPTITSTRSVWLFYDFMSLYQYGGRTPPQEGYFRQALEQMHTLYAHEAIKVRIVDELTPETWKHPGTVMVFSDQAGGVIAVSIDQLRANSTPYLLRGWCQAERQWSRLRISLEACVPMPPELFRHRMEEQGLRFTHHDDKETVLKLQAQVFAEKVRTTKQLMAENLDEEALNTLCAALPFYVDLDEIVVNGNVLPRNAAVAVANTNARSFQMESCGLKDEDVEDIVASLLHCNKVEELRLAHNDIGHRGLQALRELKKAKPDLYIDLQLEEEDEGDGLPHQEGPLGDRPLDQTAQADAPAGLGAEAEGLAQDDHRGRLSQRGLGLSEFGKDIVKEADEVEAKFRSTFGHVERLTRQRWVDVLTTAGIALEDANALLKDCDQHISVASFFDLLRGKTAIPEANSTLRDQVEAPFMSTGLGLDGLLTQQRWIGILTAIGCRPEDAQSLLKDWEPAEYISVRSFCDLLCKPVVPEAIELESRTFLSQAEP